MHISVFMKCVFNKECSEHWINQLTLLQHNITQNVSVHEICIQKRICINPKHWINQSYFNIILHRM
jgi:hypothetical protein